MNARLICLALLFFVSTVGRTQAQTGPTQVQTELTQTGPTQAKPAHRNPWYISVNAGYTLSRAGGSLVDMVQQLDKEYGINNATQKNGGGYEINVHFQRRISELVYIKTGLGYIQKQINPEENSYPLYKDSLKTSYLSIPLLFGVGIPLNKSESFQLLLEGGPSGSIKLIDKTYHGPDRAGFKTYPLVLGLQAGAGIAFKLQSAVRMQLLYSYRQDITHAYDESLYWGAPNEPIRTRSYTFRTHSFSVGVQWPLK